MPQDLTAKQCEDLPKGTPALGLIEANDLLGQVHGDWHLEGQRLVRRFTVKGYPRTVMFANAAAFLAERENHHPDIAFGWGWCEVTFWTHTVDGLSLNDFICAAKLDDLVGAL